MKFFKVATVMSLTAALAGAQVTFNLINGTFACAVSDARYCAGDSLNTNIIIRCKGTVGQPGNCNDNLAGIPPLGVKTSALCYETTPTTGDAACSFEGIVYSDVGPPFKVPSDISASLSSLATVSRTNLSMTSLTPLSTADAGNPSPLRYTTNIAGVETTIPANQTSIKPETRLPTSTPQLAYLIYAEIPTASPVAIDQDAFSRSSSLPEPIVVLPIDGARVEPEFPEPTPVLSMDGMSYGPSLTTTTTIFVPFGPGIVNMSSELAENTATVPSVGSIRPLVNASNSSARFVGTATGTVGFANVTQPTSTFTGSSSVQGAGLWTAGGVALAFIMALV